MSKTFLIEILTPERVFLTGNVRSVSVESLNGRLTVMAGHTPMVCALNVGQLHIITDTGEKKVAFHSKGFMDVTADYVVVLCQTCEWPEEIDAERAQAALQRAQKRLETDTQHVGRSKLAMLRALSRLSTKENKNNW